MNKYSRFFVILLLATLSLTTACDTVPAPVTSPYTRALDEYTAGDVEYEGAYNNFKYRTTIMNTVIQQAYIDRKTELYQWDTVKKTAELAKLQEKNATETKIFMSFFTPIRQDDNLSTPKSIWSIYLQTSHGRFEGKTTKNRDNRSELYSLFPYHQRYSSGYDVVFQVPLSQVENEETSLIVTGPLGNKTVKFPAKKF